MKFRIFDLSAYEQRVVLIIVLLLIAIAFIRYERRVHHSRVDSGSQTQPKPSPTAVDAISDQ